MKVTTLDEKRTFYVPNALSVSPLHYPGGKAFAMKYILPYFPSNIKTLFSPFFGGGKVEIALSLNGVKVYGYDIFEPLVVFWQCALEDPKKIADIVKEYYPLSGEKFLELQGNLYSYRTDKYRYAAVYFVLNRASYAGVISHGPMRTGHPDFNMRAIERLSKFSAPNLVSVEQMDFRESFKRHPNDFVFADPPYMIKCKFYGAKGDQQDFDHEALYEILKSRGGWIMTYNDCPEIRKMYRKYRIIESGWTSFMTKVKKSRELIILSNDW